MKRTRWVLRGVAAGLVGSVFGVVGPWVVGAAGGKVVRGSEVGEGPRIGPVPAPDGGQRGPGPGVAKLAESTRSTPAMGSGTTEGLVLAWVGHDARADVADPRGVLDAEDLRVILDGVGVVASPDEAAGASP